MDDDRRKAAPRLSLPARLPWLVLLLGLLLALPPQEAFARTKKKTTRSRTTAKAAPPQKPANLVDSPTGMKLPKATTAEEIKLIAKGAVLIDAFTGETLYEKNPDERLYPASSTKVLTALLVIEAGNLDQKVVIAREDTQEEPTAIGFREGEQFTRRELLYALLLKSANDVAHALARDNAGSVEAFAQKMTERAHQLGALHSHFHNPHGLHHPEHYSTPHDMALIFRAAMQQPVYRQYVSTLHHDWMSPRGIIALRNSNRLLSGFPGCTGGKTGYTVAARHVLVCAALRDHREVISVVMGSDKYGKWTDSSQLLSYGLAHPVPMPELIGPDTAQNAVSAARSSMAPDFSRK